MYVFVCGYECFWFVALMPEAQEDFLLGLKFGCRTCGKFGELGMDCSGYNRSSLAAGTTCW